jgi:hypothetical protein
MKRLRRRSRTAAQFTIAALLTLTPLCAQQSADPHSIPSVDAEIGDCSASFTITDDAGKPVYTAKVSTRVTYGFLNSHKLDLEVSTNIDGKARFTGLPGNLKHGLFFQASEGERAGSAFDDTSKTCQTQFAITLRKPSQQ